uniref:Uncharacterized protein n=1 Tax=Anguilla anguilla TaxID=7936 RepID=A0A0E9QZI7_ANGAN
METCVMSIYCALLEHIQYDWNKAWFSLLRFGQGQGNVSV